MFLILAAILRIQVSTEFLLPVSEHGVNSEQMKTWHRQGEMGPDIPGALVLRSLAEGTDSCWLPWPSCAEAPWTLRVSGLGDLLLLLLLAHKHRPVFSLGGGEWSLGTPRTAGGSLE